ncbi:hypothetical protein CC78DRAFT_195667 [Lojkania enalia]|uniref:ATP adenylyltransferase n=1 Tax=Lojkania enalia TaxID=147567 RepID=A0A9P4TR44_9PLEO|nr:hypothetical protein CC78DRAFT_195667 [Didymosphaeria enalia]
MISKENENDLETRAITQFDALVKKGEIFWEPTEEIRVQQEPFDIYFRVSPITTSKPYNPHNPSRRPGFQDDDPDFTLCTIAPNHKLILNKYCWLRPQLILHTLDFQSQRDLLTNADFEASCVVLQQIGDRYMVIFNGGPEAGSSVAHKHLQIFPRPEWETVGDEIASHNAPHKKLPFYYRLSLLQKMLSIKEIHDLYQKMCTELSIENNVAHSVVLTDSWLMVIPRKTANIQGNIPDAPMQGGANAMLGMEWLKTKEQFENWIVYGPMRAVAEFGIRDEEYERKDSNDG